MILNLVVATTMATTTSSSRSKYSLSSINLTQKKPDATQILSYNKNSKIFSFCEQTLKIGANDASGKMLQYALQNQRQNNFLIKLQAFEVRYMLFFIIIGLAK